MRHILCVLMLAMCFLLWDYGVTAVKAQQDQAAQNTSKDGEDASTEENSESNDDATDTPTSTVDPKKDKDSNKQHPSGSTDEHASVITSETFTPSQATTTGTLSETSHAGPSTPSSPQNSAGQGSNPDTKGGAGLKMEVKANSRGEERGHTRTQGSLKSMNSNAADGAARDEDNSAKAPIVKTTGPDQTTSGTSRDTTPSTYLPSKGDTKTNMNEETKDQGNKDTLSITKTSTGEGTMKTQGSDTPTSPAVLKPNDTTHNTEQTTLPTILPNGKVYEKLPILTESKAIPIPASVDKTDGILCSSSLFALAALATLAVVAAAPAH